MHKYSPFHGELIALRALEPDDIPVLDDTLNHPDLIGRRYIPWDFPDETPLSRQQVEAIYEKWQSKEKGFNLGIVLQETGVLIGYVGADWGWDTHCPRCHVVIAPEYQRLDYGTTAGNMLLRYLFENTVAHVITTGYDDWNMQAQQFARHMGFTETGLMRRTGMREGQYTNWVFADLLRREWLEMQEGV